MTQQRFVSIALLTNFALCVICTSDAPAEKRVPNFIIVIFFSDRGFHLGEHGHWSKYTLFEQSTRVPMIVRVPGLTPAGAVCDEIIELVDLVPTISELADLELPANVEGTSFVSLLYVCRSVPKSINHFSPDA